MKDRQGNEITMKEFMERWKQGMKDINPYQQSKINLIGVLLMLVGVIFGLYYTFVSKTWWMFLILLGSLFLISTNLLGLLQRYWSLKKVYYEEEYVQLNEYGGIYESARTN